MILFLTLAARGEDFSQVFNEANKLFELGKYPEAIAAYEKIIQSGTESVPVYFNLGNAFLKSGKVGRSIVAYRRAEQLSPRDPDIRANLRFARDQAGRGTAPQAVSTPPVQPVQPAPAAKSQTPPPHTPALNIKPAPSLLP